MTEQTTQPAETCCPGQIHHTDDCETRKSLAASFMRNATTAKPALPVAPPTDDADWRPVEVSAVAPVPIDRIETAVMLLESVPFGRIRKLRPEQEKAIRDLLEVWP